MRKNCSSDREKIFKIFEITRTIYSNSERSEQLLVTECFFNLFLEVSHVSKIRKIIIQNGKNNWDLETYRNSYKNAFSACSWRFLQSNDTLEHIESKLEKKIIGT